MIISHEVKFMVLLLLYPSLAMLRRPAIVLIPSVTLAPQSSRPSLANPAQKGGDVQSVSHSVWQHGLLGNQHST